MTSKQEKIEQFFDKHTWLMGDSFIKRALAIYGYVLVATWTVYSIMIVIVLMLLGVSELFS